MTIGIPLLASFYDRPVLAVAKDLLGKRLVRSLDGERISGIITEAEAYDGETDLACHARSGRTLRNRVMYGPPGYAYVYFTYGMHWCLNCVTGSVDYPAAVLIRAIQPVEGRERIAQARGRQPEALWCNGPAKLCQALCIDGQLNGVPLTETTSGLWVEDTPPVSEKYKAAGARIGIERTPEPWRSQPWRFRLLIKDGREE